VVVATSNIANAVGDLVLLGHLSLLLVSLTQMSLWVVLLSTLLTAKSFTLALPSLLLSLLWPLSRPRGSCVAPPALLSVHKSYTQSSLFGVSLLRPPGLFANPPLSALRSSRLAVGIQSLMTRHWKQCGAITVAFAAEGYGVAAVGIAAAVACSESD
jgi:hypothetical protein